MQRRSAAHLLALAAVTTASLSLTPSPVRAAEFDGNWSVLVITEKGTCDRGYRYEVLVAGGKASYNGDAAIDFAGAVSPAGAVKVQLGKGTMSAVATGKLGRDTGAGSWSGKASSGACSGRWEAERR